MQSHIYNMEDDHSKESLRAYTKQVIEQTTGQTVVAGFISYTMELLNTSEFYMKNTRK